MRALLALALFSCVPARAGVVASVESSVAPSAPSAIVPVAAPAGSGLAASILGGADLRGSIPLLPSPVPGLVPALNFVGESPAPAAAPQAAPEASPAPSAKTAPVSRPVRLDAAAAADKTPALPAKTSPGSSWPAYARDRDGAGEEPASNTASGRERSGDAARPFADASSLQRALPETAAGAGRRFFDQSREGRGSVGDRTNANRAPSTEGSSIAGKDGGSANGSGGVASRTGDAASGSRDSSGYQASPRSGSLVPSEGEVLRDAVAGVPSPAAAGGAVSFFRAAAPNGELPPGAAGAALTPPVEPRPLALDLSGSGLIVRVRSALGAALPAAASAELPSRPLAAASASTAMLERGAMLEAFSVAGAYAGSSGAGSAAFVPSPSSARSVPVPSRAVSAAPSSWWALLLLLPSLGLAARRFL